MFNPFRGLRAGILTQLIFLIVAAMLLINVVMLNLYERDLLRAREESGRLLILALEQHISLTYKSDDQIRTFGHDEDFKNSVHDLLSTGGFSCLAAVLRNSEISFCAGKNSNQKTECGVIAREAMSRKVTSVYYRGSTWGILWPRKRDMFVSAPIRLHDNSIGGIAIHSSLIPTYDLIRKSEKLILLYIFLDTIILAVVGIFLLSRIVIKPVHRLLKMTEEYNDGEIIISDTVESRDEIGNLTKSLRNMLTRLDRNKKELKNYILSLENANSELKSAQTEIIRSEKLASVGRLSAGIAHEIGNPLGIILGYLELIKKDDIPDCDKGDFLQRIEAEITRINVIIRQLLDFSRPSRGVKERVDVHELIINTLEILKPQSMMENIEVSLSLNAPEQALITDSNQLQQVFLNIMMNAADAMSHKETMDDRESGKLLIETKNSEDKIVIIFADNGPGIAQEDISKIFDPFYTTKEPGLGTGLGLSVCYRIVDDLEGDIRAESSTGKGMTIIVTLPLEGPLKIRSINYIETGER